MKYAADFRESARGALKGKWGIALGAGLLAGILGGTTSSGFSLNFDTSSFEANADMDAASIQEIITSPQFLAMFIGVLTVIVLSAVVISLLYFFVGSVVNVGYARFNLALVDSKEASIGQLFSYFSSWGKGVAAAFLKELYIFLWSLLFIIPGIIAIYSYAMTSYILAECPELSANEAIAKSKEMMKGNKGRLFCLELSFIGWDILCVFTCGIGNLWLNPYKQAALADFYREISDTRPKEETFFEDGVYFEEE